MTSWTTAIKNFVMSNDGSKKPGQCEVHGEVPVELHVGCEYAPGEVDQKLNHKTYETCYSPSYQQHVKKASQHSLADRLENNSVENLLHKLEEQDPFGTVKKVEDIFSTQKKVIDMLYKENSELRQQVNNVGLLERENYQLKEYISRLERQTARSHTKYTTDRGIQSKMIASSSFRAPERKVVRCFIKYTPTEVVENVQREFLTRLESKLLACSCELKHEAWNHREPSNTPIIVFCVKQSRLGTDVESALRDIKEFQACNIILVILHPASHGGLHITPSESILRDIDRRVCVSSDILFSTSQNGAYLNCQTNDVAVDKCSAQLMQ